MPNAFKTFLKSLFLQADDQVDAVAKFYTQFIEPYLGDDETVLATIPLLNTETVKQFFSLAIRVIAQGFKSRTKGTKSVSVIVDAVSDCCPLFARILKCTTNEKCQNKYALFSLMIIASRRYFDYFY